MPTKTTRKATKTEPITFTTSDERIAELLERSMRSPIWARWARWRDGIRRRRCRRVRRRCVAASSLPSKVFCTSTSSRSGSAR